MTDRKMSIYYKKRGGHVHCRVFTGVPDYTFAKCGELVFDEKEWHEVYLWFLGSPFMHKLVFEGEADK